MKTVFQTEQVINKFLANDSQKHYTNSQRNVSVSNNKLFSYSTVIAEITNGFLLKNTISYTNTTAKTQSKIYSSYLKTIRLKTNEFTNISKCLKLISIELLELATKYNKAKKEHTKKSYSDALKREIKNYRNYLEFSNAGKSKEFKKQIKCLEIAIKEIENEIN